MSIDRVAAPTGSRLEQLADEYTRMKAAADEAKTRLDMIVDAIKLELHNAKPHSNKVEFTAPGLAAPLRMQSRTSWRVDTKMLKAEQPEVYVRYAKQYSYWELRTVRGGDAG